MIETLEQLEWIRTRLEPMRYTWTEEAAIEAAGEAYRRFPESETVGRALIDFSLCPSESLDLAIAKAKAGR